jgi:2-polyprenyl-3-methyl-5-hydroxy-6-metoxy-1,4-benzoquinol methylase
MYTTIDDLRSQLGGPMRHSAAQAAYDAKMMHALPAAETVDREAFFCRHATGKAVLEFGASGRLHEALMQVAARYVGIDREAAPGVLAFDLDDIEAGPLPQVACDLILCGEILEHLSNPGWFLTRLRRQYLAAPLIVSVPNAFSAIAARHVAHSIENVNRDHVAWYSPTTLGTLLTRAGYTIGQLFYYHGTGPTSEGLVVCAE